MASKIKQRGVSGHVNSVKSRVSKFIGGGKHVALSKKTAAGRAMRKFGAQAIKEQRAMQGHRFLS
jgi:hypothetical protein